MRYSLCDVNVLVPLVYGGHPHSRTAIAWYEQCDGVGELGVSRLSQVGALRLLNNPIPMGSDVLSGAKAWAGLDRLFEDKRFVLLDEPYGLDLHFRELTMRLNHSPKVWSDAYLAAFAIASGRKLVTFDRGFQAYPGLDVEVLG